MNYRAVLFDFDYTLGDATQAIFTAFTYAFTQMGLSPADRERVRGTIGMMIPDAYALLTGDPSPENAQVFYSHFHPVARDLQAQGVVDFFPGALELLTALRAAGLSAGLVSTKSTETLVSVLKIKKVEDLFSLVVGGGSVPSHKPDPEGLLWGIEQLGLERKDILYCGDTVIDAETAKNAGVDFCAVLNGTTPARAFDAWPSVHISPDLWDLKAWLGV